MRRSAGVRSGCLCPIDNIRGRAGVRPDRGLVLGGHFSPSSNACHIRCRDFGLLRRPSAGSTGARATSSPIGPARSTEVLAVMGCAHARTFRASLVEQCQLLVHGVPRERIGRPLRLPDPRIPLGAPGSLAPSVSRECVCECEHVLRIFEELLVRGFELVASRCDGLERHLTFGLTGWRASVWEQGEDSTDYRRRLHSSDRL